MKLLGLSEGLSWMLPSAELGKGNHHNTTDYLKNYLLPVIQNSVTFTLWLFSSWCSLACHCISKTRSQSSHQAVTLLRCLSNAFMSRTVFTTQPAVINIVPILL